MRAGTGRLYGHFSTHVTALPAGGGIAVEAFFQHLVIGIHNIPSPG
jgi:hypothetical protein